MAAPKAPVPTTVTPLNPDLVGEGNASTTSVEKTTNVIENPAAEVAAAAKVVVTQTETVIRTQTIGEAACDPNALANDGVPNDVHLRMARLEDTDAYLKGQLDVTMQNVKYLFAASPFEHPIKVILTPIELPKFEPPPAKRTAKEIGMSAAKTASYGLAAAGVMFLMMLGSSAGVAAGDHAFGTNLGNPGGNN
jgi:hypothetical protein